MALPKHGSNPKYLYQQMGLEMPQKIIDFSVNLNPLGPPQILFEHWESWREEIIDYPDPLGENLKAKLSTKEEIGANNILLGNGAAELIQLVAIYLQGKKIALFQPTFSEYERMTSAYGAQLRNVKIEKLTDEKYLKELAKNQEAIFLCHPNNPTGESYSASNLERLRMICEENKTYLIIDEAFYDFSEEVYSMLKKVKDSEFLIILRSATKMFSIAGIRLGYLFAAEKIVKELRSLQPYWSVNAIALKMGELIIDEDNFVKESQNYIKEIRQEVFPILKEEGFLLSDSQVNFFLLRDPDIGNQEELLLFLLKNGIVPRHTENYPYLDGHYLRFAIRPLDEMNQLLEVLRKWKERLYL